MSHRCLLRSGVVATATLLLAAGAAHAIPGATDQRPAASLLVPFFETARDFALSPENTLLAVTNSSGSAQLIHYHVWNNKGVAAFSGNVNLGASATWEASMFDLINAQSAAVKTTLTSGIFYLGFVTIDTVSSPTALKPTEAGYPLAAFNILEGYIYYTRLAVGSANGLPMVSLEAVNPSTSSSLKGFYRPSDNREEIDVDSRACANQLANGQTCTGDADHMISRIHVRSFGAPSINGKTKLIVFTWAPQSGKAGPSDYCAVAANNCATLYPFKVYDGSGGLVFETEIGLANVVNVISVATDLAGFASIWNVPSTQSDMQVYAFAFNSAYPSSNPDLTWDAIFEGFITP